MTHRIKESELSDKARAMIRKEAMPSASFGTYADHATLMVHYEADTINAVYRNVGSEIRARKKVQEFTERAWIAAGRPKFRAPWRIKSIIVFMTNMKRDPLNCEATWLKFGIDALVALGCLPGDGWANIAPPKGQTFWYVDKKNPRVVVTIEQVQDAF